MADNVTATLSVTEEVVTATVDETTENVSVTVVGEGPQTVSVEVSNDVGPKGDAATISVGTVTTGAAGSSASVTNAGTSAAAVLNFAIPRGDKGDKGDTGEPGTTAWSGITDKPTSFTPSSHTHTASQITDFSSAVVAAAPPTTNASLLTSGTLADARLSSAVAASLSKADSAVQNGDESLVLYNGASITTIQPPFILPFGDVTITTPGASGTLALVSQLPTVFASTAISDSTVAGRALLTAANSTAQRTSLGLGTAAQSNAGDFATAAQGTLADTAVQPVAYFGFTVPAESTATLVPNRNGWYEVEAMGAGCSVILPTTGAASGDVARVTAISNPLAVKAVIQGPTGPFGEVVTAVLVTLQPGQSATFLNVSGMGQHGQSYLWELVAVDTHAHTISGISGLQTALDSKATLDGGGKIPSSLLPSYVDDVLEYANLAGFPGTGEAGKIYVALDTNKTYRWSGSAYIEISPSPGTTDSLTEGSVNLYFTNVRAAAAAPVQSVAGKTGAVTLTYTDVGAAAASHTHTIANVTNLQTTLDNKLNNNADSTLTGVLYLSRPSSTSARLRAAVAPATGFSVRNLTIDTQRAAGPLYNENQLYLDGTTGFVGVLKNTPASALDVNGTITGTAITTTGADSTMNGVLYVTRPGGEPSRIRGSIGPTAGISSRNLVLDTQNGAIPGYNENQIYLDGSTGFVGIRKSAPSTVLDVNGSVTAAAFIATAGSAPSSPTAGTIYFSSSDNHFYGYNGTTWKQLDN